MGNNSNIGFFEAYYDMLKKVKNNYSQSRIICGTLMEGCLKDDASWKFPHKWMGISLYEYNAAIKIAAKLSGVDLIDLASLNKSYETLDGTHPTKAGHQTIAEAWITCLQNITL